jgi:hypothetical protein
MKNALRILVAVALVVTATAAFAGETGSISGVVKDGTGAPVPGATVKIFGPQNPAGYNAVTRSNGTYNFQKLLPGSYTVEAELKGLGKAARKVNVTVDNDSQIDLVLVQSATAEVVVTAATAEVDKKSSEVNVNFTGIEVRQLPLSRTYEGLLNLIPGAPASDGSSGYVSISGGTRQDNKYLVDGVNITSPNYGYIAVDTNQMDISDVNVKRGAITAEFGRTSGAVVNAVTKSGTNDLRGEVRFQMQPNSFRAAPAHASTSEVDNYIGSASLGFPIVKDVLFGYASGRYSDTKTSGQSATIGGVTTTQPDTKTYDGDYFGKLTAFLGQSLLLNAGFRVLPTKTTNGFDSAYDAGSAAWNSKYTNYVGNVTADWFATKDTVVEAKYVHMLEQPQYQAANVLSGQPTTIDPKALYNYGQYSDPARNGGNSGVYYVTNGGEKHGRDEVRLTFSQFLDIGPTQNQFKVGGGAEFADYDILRASNGWGILSTGATCPAGVCGTSSKTGQIRARYYSAQPEQLGRARTYSFFVQDTLTWGRLTANLGVLFNRDDFAQVCAPGVLCGSSDINTERRFNFLTFPWSQEVQPRLGLVYNAELLKGDKFYGSYGQYANLDQKSAARSHAPYRNREDYSFFDPTTGVLVGTQVRGSSTGHKIPPDLKAPYVLEWILGYSAPVGRDWTFDVYYQYRNLKTPLEDTPINGIQDYNGFFMLANFPDAKHVYEGITFDAQKRYSNGWYFDVNYTYGKLYGNWDDDYQSGQYSNSSNIQDAPGTNYAEPNRYGRLGQDRPHILKMMGSYDIFGFTLGGFLRVQSGTPWQAQNADPYTGSYYLYTEPAGSRRLPTWTNFDLLGAYTFNLGGSMSLRLEGRLQNLFNSQPATGINYTNRAQYLDSFVSGPPPLYIGTQTTTKPNANFGNATSWASPRRFVLTAYFNF